MFTNVWLHRVNEKKLYWKSVKENQRALSSIEKRIPHHNVKI